MTNLRGSTCQDDDENNYLFYLLVIASAIYIGLNINIKLKTT
jgi:hypothetical protein